MSTQLTKTHTTAFRTVSVAVPGDFPRWFKLEQGVCGLLLLGVVLVVNGKHLRTAFSGR